MLNTYKHHGSVKGIELTSRTVTQTLLILEDPTPMWNLCRPTHAKLVSISLKYFLLFLEMQYQWEPDAMNPYSKVCQIGFSWHIIRAGKCQDNPSELQTAGASKADSPWTTNCCHICTLRNSSVYMLFFKTCPAYAFRLHTEVLQNP